MKSYFGVNYTNHWNYNISPGNAMATITTGDRVKYDWHTTTQLAPNNNVIIGAEHETETLQTATVSAQNVNKAGYMELQSQFPRSPFPDGQRPAGRQRAVWRASDLSVASAVDRAGHGYEVQGKLRHRVQGADA